MEIKLETKDLGTVLEEIRMAIRGLEIAEDLLLPVPRENPDNPEFREELDILSKEDLIDATISMRCRLDSWRDNSKKEGETFLSDILKELDLTDDQVVKLNAWIERLEKQDR